MTQDYKNVSYRGFRTLIAFTLLTLIASATMFHPSPVAAQTPPSQWCFVGVVPYATDSTVVATGSVECTIDNIDIPIETLRVTITNQDTFEQDTSEVNNITISGGSTYALNASLSKTDNTIYIATTYVKFDHNTDFTAVECFQAGVGSC